MSSNQFSPHSPLNDNPLIRSVSQRRCKSPSPQTMASGSSQAKVTQPRRFSLAQSLANFSTAPVAAHFSVKGSGGSGSGSPSPDATSPTSGASKLKAMPIFGSPTKATSPLTGVSSSSSKVHNQSFPSDKSKNIDGAVPQKRRHSRINFLHRMGSEATPDMQSLSLHPSKNHQKPSELYRLVVLGGPKVGKTAIVQRFLYNKFPETHSATVEELHRSDYEVKGLGVVSVEILDTSGSFAFPAMQRLAISGGEYNTILIQPSFFVTTSDTLYNTSHLLFLQEGKGVLLTW